MSFFCALTPLVFDDYGYGAGSSTIAGLFSAQLHEHLAWSGKFIGHFMARVLLHGPSWLHPLLSPMLFIGLIFSGIVLTLGIQWKSQIRAWHFILLAGLCWFSIPAFGTVFFWRTATPDYGYSLFFATAFLVPYRFWLDDKDYRLPGGILFVFAGILAGWSNENVGALAVLAAILVTLYRFWDQKKVPLWAIAGIVGAITGWSLMMTAPGNAIRLEQIGGVEKIPALSPASLNRFLMFYGTQELELMPYILSSLVCIMLLYKQNRLEYKNIMPGLIFFFMSQISLGAFVFSPSTPYRAMTSTFFFESCSLFSFIVYLNALQTWRKYIYIIFCIVLLISVFEEVDTFTKAQPAIMRRNNDKDNGTLTAESFNYPKTDKYFFPTYDIIELNAYSDSDRNMMIPWNKSVSLKVEGYAPAQVLVISNMIYLNGLPEGEVSVAAIANRQTFASLIQSLLRKISPTGKIASSSEINARYAVASASVSENGKAILHIPGVDKISNIKYIQFKEDKSNLYRSMTKY